MKTALKFYKETLKEIENNGLLKNEKVITTPQGANVELSDGKKVVNLCANNYLGLGNNKDVIDVLSELYG